MVGMKTIVFSRKGQPGKAATDQLLEELKRLKINYENLDIDSREGVAKAELYDVVQTPAVITTQDDGKLLYAWQELLPDPSELNRIAFI